MEKQEFIEIIDRYLAGQATAIEEQMLINYFESYQKADAWNDSVHGSQAAALTEVYRQLQANMHLHNEQAATRRIPFLKTAWFRYAAVLLLIAGAAVFIYIRNQPPQRELAVKPINEKADILPGGNKAILTLADGSRIVLDSVSNGNLANQGNTKILKLNAGALAYQAGTATGEILYNTISTPKGGQYQVGLPDGSKVWLNAASSIRFPTAFVKDRKVTVTGEVYFEIADDKSKPFAVKAGNAEILVLGTRFNTNAYSDEPVITTTLLEGSVKVSNPCKQLILKPGQQAQVKPGGQMQLIHHADTEQSIAWKNGAFAFHQADLRTVMRQLARWYDVEIEIPAGMPDWKFNGEIGRSLTLTQVLKGLGETSIRYRMENDRKIVLLP